MQKITPFLWFDSQAEEAVGFYTSIFKDSKILTVTRYGAEGAEASGRPEGTVMTIAFRLFGQEFVALNGGPIFKFTEAISFVIHCESQDEVDHYWDKRLSSIASRRTKWTITGTNCPGAETRRRSNAAG
jgi:predicted 3-demethylubiquinone-9 3-methyltransferase (glyoxalase superfamily)